MKKKYYTIGIDSGTQSTKAVLMDVATGCECAIAVEKYRLYEKNDGSREQNPADWISAVKKTICAVVKSSKISPEQVLGIGVSGQQHGFVPLDKKGNVIRRAKLWNDTSTQKQAADLIKKLGGLKRTISAIGNSIPPGFTASKIKWLKENEPANYKKLSLILLPHNYINYWLTGRAVMEAGDASGTALFDIKKREWSKKAIRALDDKKDISKCLPEVQNSNEIIGTLKPSVAKTLGLSEKCIVSTGGGDNMMAAIGTGNVKKGVVTASLGTSGTIFAYSDKPVIDEKAGEIAAFCDSTGAWLPLLCVMNCTVSTELVKTAFGISTDQLGKYAKKIKPGAEGLLLLPYFSGERTPNIPDGKGVMYGLTALNFTAAHFCRAAMEGAAMSINYGVELLRSKKINPKQIRLTGGGAKNPLWRQICADVFNTECRTLKSEEAAAVGAAIQALWAYETAKNGEHKIEKWTDKFVKLGRTVHLPNKENVKLYKEIYNRQQRLSEQLLPVFSKK